MKVELQLCDMEYKFIVNNIYPLYLHDLSEIWERTTNQYGVFEESDIRTLAEQNRVFDVWWEHPDVLFPFLIKVDGIPAGFAFVATPPYTPCPPYINYFLNEFFLLRHYRGKGVGEQAMQKLLDRMPGHWEIQTNPTDRNKHAQNFWRKTLHACTKGSYNEQLVHLEQEMLSFRFTISKD